MRKFEKKDFGNFKLYEVNAELIEGVKNYMVMCKVAKDAEHVAKCEEILASIYANGGQTEGKNIGVMKAYAKRFAEACAA